MPIPRIDLETAEPQSLGDILDWHRGIADALLEQRASVQRAIRTGAPVGARFLGMTEIDVDQYHDAQRMELDRLTVLNLVASAEASIRIDYFRRVGDKLKDTLSRAYRAWHKKLSAKKRRRPDFDERGILDVLKGADVLDKHLIGRYRACLAARHWIGHGRYWAKPVEFDPDDVSRRADELLKALPV